MKRALPLLMLLPAACVPDPQISTRAEPTRGSTAPLFVENVGQFDADVRFRAQAGSRWLDPSIDLFSLGARSMYLTRFDDGLRSTIELRFAGARDGVMPRGFDASPAHVSFLRGVDSYAGVPVFAGVIYEDLYPGVDLLFVPDEQGGFLPELHVASPEAREQVHLEIYGDAGDIAIAELPLASESNVATSQRALVGNALVFSTFFGGTADEEINGLATDPAGNIYITGTIGWSGDTPVTPGAFDVTRGGLNDAYVAKLDPVTNTLVYSTYLAGSDSEGGNAIYADANGYAYVAGATHSADFPTTPFAFARTKKGDADAFLVRLNTTGSALVYSTFIGGSLGDWANAIAVDASGAVTIAGDTKSADYPVTGSVYDNSHNGGRDIFITRFNSSGSALLASTFIGGTDADGANAVALDASGIYFAGGSSSTNFPTTAGAYDRTDNAGDDVVAGKMSLSLSGMIYGTYLGGSDYEWADAIALRNGYAYLTGSTTSPDFPTSPGAYDTVHNGPWDAFVVRLQMVANSSLISTLLGGADQDLGNGIAVTNSGVYVSGTTGSNDFPTSVGAFDTTSSAFGDLFVVRLSSILNVLDYGTYLGGSSSDAWNAELSLAPGEQPVVGGESTSSDYPLTPGAPQTVLGGARDIVVTRLN